MGLSDQKVAFVVGGLGLVSTVVLLVAIAIQEWDHLFTILFSVYALTVFLSLFLICKIYPEKSQLKNEKEPINIKKSA